MDPHPTLPPKGGTTNCAFHCFRATRSVMLNSYENGTQVLYFQRWRHGYAL